MPGARHAVRIRSLTDDEEGNPSMSLHLDAASVRAAAEHLTPEPIREHWVMVDDRRYPPKQLVHAATGIARTSYNSRQALAALNRCGFTTSDIPSPRTAPDLNPADDLDPVLLRRAFTMVMEFLATENLTARIARLEADLEGIDQRHADALASASGLSAQITRAAIMLRRHTGRIDDLIHASVITQALPLILVDGERVTRRPSLASGDDSTRPFDLETDRRVAEFEIAVWKGSDTMRSRTLVTDLVELALAQPGRTAELYVVGERPIRFLTTSTVTVQWALGRALPDLRSRFVERFGQRDISVREFTSGPARHVVLRDLTKLLPGLTALR
jgi:hypothetical protein